MIRHLFTLRLSLRDQLIYGIGLFLTVLLTIFIYIETTNSNEFTRSKELTSTSEHTYAFSSMVKVWVMSNDYSGLEEALENFSIYEELLFASVIDMDGKILAHTQRSLVGTYVADKERIAFLKRLQTTHENDEKIILEHASIDAFRVIHHKQTHIGFVHLRFDRTFREEQIELRIFEGVAFGTFYLLVVIVLLYLIVNSFTKQLTLLVETIKKVHSGGKSVRAPLEGKGEISDLAEEFNSMLDALQDSEKTLLKTKEQLEYAVTGTQDGLWDWEVGTDNIFFSPRFKAILGYEDHEFSNSLEAWTDRIHPDDMKGVDEAIELSLAKPGIFYESVHRVQKKSGEWIWVLDRGQTIFNDEQKAVRMVGFYTDITKQKRLEIELLEQEELIIAQSRHVAMGEMIGMIAHQWRQPLTVIAMGANNILVDIELEQTNEERFKHEAKGILKQTEYLSKTIDDFRNFFRPDKEKDETNVYEVVMEAQQIMGKSLEYHNIKLMIEGDKSTVIKTYSRELLQVILNLIKNSKEALEEKKNSDAFIRVRIQKKEHDVVITICDNGKGIKKEIINKIFDPYFSTKDAKTGTGLGLYMSKTIVTKHLAGTIQAENQSVGVCFIVTFPC